MVRKRAGKKIKKEREVKKIAPLKLPTKKILQFAFVFALIPISFAAIKNASYFNLADVKIIDRENTSALTAGEALGTYKGRNIFDIDINSIARGIKIDYPFIDDARVRRVLPDTLEVEIIPRLPVALLDSHEYFPVDRTGMVLLPVRERGELPVITGFSIWLVPRAGEKLENKQLESAFLLLDALEEAPLPAGYNVTRIDATNYKNLSFYLENGIEVKIGQEKFLGRLKMLKATLAKPDMDTENIKYIDLRFKDVVIGPK